MQERQKVLLLLIAMQASSSIGWWNSGVKSYAKHGRGSVIIWSCFVGAVVGDIIKVEGILKEEQFRQVCFP